MKIIVTRTKKTADGILGTLTLDFNPFTCFTVENLAKAINPGVYNVTFDYSPHFNRTMPHIVVPDRDELAGGDAGIRIHYANYPCQVGGCVAVGDKEESDAVDDSIVTFNALYKLISPLTGLQIEIVEAYATETPAILA